MADSYSGQHPKREILLPPNLIDFLQASFPLGLKQFQLSIVDTLYNLCQVEPRDEVVKWLHSNFCTNLFEKHLSVIIRQSNHLHPPHKDATAV